MLVHCGDDGGETRRGSKVRTSELIVMLRHARLSFVLLFLACLLLRLTHQIQVEQRSLGRDGPSQPAMVLAKGEGLLVPREPRPLRGPDEHWLSASEVASKQRE